MKNWFEINNKAKETAEIWIYSEIGGFDVNAKSFIDELREVKGKNLDVHINSLGGSVFDGLAIYNALKNHKGKVTTKVEGIAASIASVIAMAGDDVEMAKNSLFMIHNPFTMAGGDANELRKTANVLDKIRDEIAEIYATKSDQDIETLVGLMNAETWLNADETLQVGFANMVSDSVEIVNNYDVSKFNNITEEKINSIILNNKKEEKIMANEINEEKGLIEQIKSLFKNQNESIQNAEGDEDGSEAEDTDWAKTYEELKDQVKNLEDAVHKIEEQLGMKEEEIADKVGQLETANEEVQNLSNEISKLKATKTDVVADQDPNIGTDKVVDENSAFYNAMLKGLQRKA
jgi:ATP-dependent Clp endopeptidase proteolytic subunit ClpP